MRSIISNDINKVKDKPNFVLFTAPSERLEDVAREVREKFPEIPSMGTLGTTFTQGHVSNEDTTFVAMYGVKVEAGVIEGLSKCPILSIREIEDNIRNINSGKEDTVCFEFCTNSEGRLVTLLNSALKGIPLVGGTVFGDTSKVAYNGEIYEDASCYALIKNMTGKIKIYKENIYESTTDHVHLVTKVDIANRGLVELDYLPAHEVYSKETGVPKSEIVDNVLKNPLGRVIGDEVYISSMREMLPDNTIVSFKRLNKNDTVKILTLMDYREIGKLTRENIKRDIANPALVLSVDCILRYMLFENESYTQEHAKAMGGLGPHLGIVGGGEQFEKQHVNQTMVCAVFE